jgi:hypothetical protein
MNGGNPKLYADVEKAIDNSVPAQIATTVQNVPKDDIEYLGNWHDTQRGPHLPEWGTRDRDRKLWQYYHHDRATFVQGIFAAIGKKIVSTPATITGPVDDLAHWQDFVFDSPNFGAGYENLVMGGVINFLRYDIGAVFEKAGAGRADAPLLGPVTGIELLDSRYVYPTRNPIYPFYYWSATSPRGISKKGTWHKLHHTRVDQIVDIPESDQHRGRGFGLCALSRVIDIVAQDIYVSRYMQIALDDKPKPGITGVSNLSDKNIQLLEMQMREIEQSDVFGSFGRHKFVTGINRTLLPEFSPVQWIDTPESFNYKDITETHVNMYAFAIGIPKTLIWEITTSGLGQGTQSRVLSEQGEGMTIAQIRRAIERMINRILPPEYEFRFEYDDIEKDNQVAQQANTWVSTVQAAADILTVDERRSILTNNVKAVQDILRNPDGSIRSLTDRDPEPVAQATDATAPEEGETQPGSAPTIAPAQQPIITDLPGTVEPEESLPENISAEDRLNGAQIAAAIQVLGGINDGTTAPSVAAELLIALGINPVRANRMVNDTKRNISPKVIERTFKLWSGYKRLTRKVFSQTRQDFVSRLMDVFQRNHTGRRGGIRLSNSIRVLLRRLGEQAYRDGMEQAGVMPPDDLDTEDKERLAIWEREQSAYVTNLIQGDQEIRKGLTPEQARLRADFWANKSLRDAFNLGKASGKGNGMFRWVWNPVKEHCPTCAALNGQIHRMKDYIRSGFTPGSSRLLCKGYHCGCDLVSAPGAKAEGRLPLNLASE